jgi:hypothetical protein
MPDTAEFVSPPHMVGTPAWRTYMLTGEYAKETPPLVARVDAARVELAHSYSRRLAEIEATAEMRVREEVAARIARERDTVVAEVQLRERRRCNAAIVKAKAAADARARAAEAASTRRSSEAVEASLRHRQRLDARAYDERDALLQKVDAVRARAALLDRKAALDERESGTWSKQAIVRSSYPPLRSPYSASYLLLLLTTPLLFS